MTKADIVSRMAAAAGWPKAGTERALRAALGGIRASLKRGDAVTLVGFGTFSVARRKPRTLKNPRTGQAVTVAGRIPRFKPSKELKQAGRFERSLESVPVHRGRTLAALAVLVAAFAPLAATAQPGRSVADGRPLSLSAEAVLLLDPEGRTLFAKNPDEERAPASLVKLMTLYLAFEDIEARRADLDELVPVSRYAALT